MPVPQTQNDRGLSSIWGVQRPQGPVADLGRSDDLLAAIAKPYTPGRAKLGVYQTKFQLNYWRPITAIRAGDNDGNRATNGDPNWEPLYVTPPFPEYPSTHAATAAPAAGARAPRLSHEEAWDQAPG